MHGGANSQNGSARFPCTTRWLLRFGYNGRVYHGWARQPGLRTVEGTIAEGVRKRGICASNGLVSIEVASRTDRGVSAVGNALVLSSSLSGGALLRALNGIVPDIVFTAARRVTDEFRVRSAVRRCYRYFQPAEGHDFQRWQEIAPLFEGRIDVRSFGRGIPSGAPVWRAVESLTVVPEPEGAVIEFRAPSFVWGMVRKIVAAFREVEAGRLSKERLQAAIAGRFRLTLPLAEPEPLVLWDVEYDHLWEFRWTGPNRHQAARVAAARSDLWVQGRLLDALAREHP